MINRYFIGALAVAILICDGRAIAAQVVVYAIQHGLVNLP